MNIALDNRAKEFSGIGIYTRSLCDEYKKQGHTVYLYNDNIRISRFSWLGKYIKFALRILKEQININHWLKLNNVKIYHVTKNLGVPFITKCPVIVTIHDIIPHIYSNEYLSNIIERIYYELAIRVSIYRSRKIITISEFSKQELIKYYNVSPSKIVVIPLAFNTCFKVLKKELYRGVIEKKYNIKTKYILTIGGSEYRKNIQRLINVYQNNDFDNYELVIIGGKWRNIDLSTKYKQNKKIKFITDVEETDLVLLYNMAEVFVFPSFYEGFGIPILEGMACGTAVITSNVSSMPEVAGDAALYFDPYDEKDIACKIKLVLNNSKLREELVTKGLNRIKTYSWEKCANETLMLYSRII